MPVIRGAPRLPKVWTKLSGRALFDELIVDEKVHFHAPGWVVVVHRPTGNRLRVSVV